MTKISESQQAIEAINFDAPGSLADKQTAISNASSSIQHDKKSWWHSQFNLMLCVFALLICSAILFVLLVPPPSSSQALVANSGDSVESSSTGTANSNVTVNSSVETPFSDAERQQARTDSQDVLADLLASKKNLQTRNVNEWAPERFQAALDLAQAGDDFYSQKNYVQAINTYKQSVAELEALNQLIPEILNKLVAEGRDAIDKGKTQLAKQVLNKALVLDQNNIAALTAMGRANNLDQVLALLRSAKEQETAFATSDVLSDLSAAESDYQAASQLDDENATAKEGLQRVIELAKDKRFRVEMSAGYKALFKNRFTTAKSAFSKALSIKPIDATAKAAYQQSLAADKSSSLSSLISAAQRFERNEQWANALSNYQAVLARDPNQVSAKLGQIRSQARGDLDSRIKEVLSDRLSLARASQKEVARNVLSDAKSISKKGARLNQQIAQIEAALSSADLALKVTLSSDGLSSISLKKEGAKAIALGRFSNKKLSLKPGRYVLSATRLGFRDERKELELTPGNSGVLSFSIRCDQQINSVAGTSTEGA